MTNAPATIEQPHFIVDDSADESVRDRLHVLERRINEKPEIFQQELASLGELATAGTIEYDNIDERQVSLTRSAKEIIAEFFTQRLDLDVSFDDSTEAALLADDKHAVLLDEVKSKHSERLQLGKTTSTTRANEQAIPAREKLRRYRLEFYIGRVLASKHRSGTKGDDLRTAG
jgi:hypothetical protein